MHSRTLVQTVMILTIAILAFIQIPLDLRTHRLSRRATVTASILVIGIGFVDSVIGWSFGPFFGALIGCLVLLVMYGGFHLFSPLSIGFGDVILVIPLAFAVASQSWMSLLLWQSLATLGGACHGIYARIKYREKTIPFGPHLLVSALAVVLMGTQV